MRCKLLLIVITLMEIARLTSTAPILQVLSLQFYRKAFFCSKEIFIRYTGLFFPLTRVTFEPTKSIGFKKLCTHKEILLIRT